MKPLINWLETSASSPAYSGWVLLGIAICFFGAGINTMAGWLYVISGVSFALLGVAAILPPRSLTHLSITRHPITPVSAGDELSVELEVSNSGKQSVNLLQIADILPFVLGKPTQQAIETIPPQTSHRWQYHHPAPHRGVYRWQTVELATGAPLGLFWCRRQHQAPATAYVYPQVLSLTQCPLIDQMGEEDSLRGDPRGKPLSMATEGLVRSLRPYRLGDPMRLIHWRSSARYGDLRVRELELITGGQEVVIALDTASNWQPEDFEQAVIAAASMYFYAQKQQLALQLWTAATGIIKGEYRVLETLAATNPQEDRTHLPPTSYPIIWLTSNPLTLTSLPAGSRWLLWQYQATSSEAIIINQDLPGKVIQTEESLQLQLQA
ncbi:DUF58 domain-containing protein [Calothrix sp. 336/3]|uniref:DUF58 domain-containing protein n=1 Tax=Calothrix sp. 336/3 TaxID=1337936 RepID=UPI0004E41C88|nr:DUF58 domain-containing protein [Calothrix sp. 336/3]AKG22064.1 hypothetical protein IJ00_13085 [Calothrix sp. 336/3]